jgi:hypothetical protein
MSNENIKLISDLIDYIDVNNSTHSGLVEEICTKGDNSNF